MRGDEQAIRKALREDARGLRKPVYFRFILTVDNPAAARFRRLDGYICQRVLRDAVEKTFRGTARALRACLRCISTAVGAGQLTLMCTLC